MILHICKLASGFFIHIGEQKMILHIYGPKSGFFYSHGWRKKWYCTLVGPKVVFFIYISEEKNDIEPLWA
jgi:hypothetical protein